MRLSIFRKIWLFIFTLLILSMGSATMINIFQFEGNYREALQKAVLVEGRYLQERINKSLMLGFSLEAIPGIDEQCRKIVNSHSEISSCCVVAKNREILYHGDPRYVGAAMESSVNLESPDPRVVPIDLKGKKYYEVRLPIFDDNAVIGSVRLNLPFESIRKKTLNMLLGVSVLLVVLLMVASLVAFYVVRNITWPLKALTSGARRIAEGDFEHDLTIGSKDEVGQLAHSFSTMASRLQQRDISLRKAREELETRVRERTEELVKANEKLQQAIHQAEEMAKTAEQANRAKSNFLANMSHEIRTPMNAVIGFTEMLIDSDLNEKHRDYVKTIQQSGEALLALINDILDFSKIETGNLDFEQIDFDPELLAYDVCELIRPKLDSKPIEILCHVDDAVPAMIKGDPFRFRQVLTNLMGNASKFTAAGEIQLTLEVTRQKENAIELHAKIRDTGPGVQSQVMESIFLPFQQADNSTTRKFGGTGLGLAICRQISQLMGGDVWVESSDCPQANGEQLPGSDTDQCRTEQIGPGSTFHFTGWFEKSSEPPIHRITPESIAGKKILVVDDNESNLKILQYFLENVDARVTRLDGGDRVLSTLENARDQDDPFDLCICDIVMPDLNGYEVAKQVRTAPHPVSQTPLIALASVMRGDAKKCGEAGFDAFLSKPIRREKLYRMLEQLLGSSRKKSPIRQPDKKTIITQYSVREKIKQSTSILLVEDNRVNQKLATMMLAKAGYRVDVAENGQIALEKFFSDPRAYDLILMDIQMPEVDGITATRQIRAEGYRSIPIIAMTAHVMKGDRESCIEAGMDDYIPKPINRGKVFEIIEKWVLKRATSGRP